MKWLLRCLYLQFRILTLTANRKELLSLDTDVLWWGLLMVWFAGLGRYWDNPMESEFLRTGFPSLIYIWVLGAFLWMFIFLLRPANWSYLRLVTFISMTAVPAFLYAIPFERMYGFEQAAEYNAIALVVVATWRVLMLGNYLLRTTNLNILCVLSALLLPLMTIVFGLMATQRLEQTIGMMGGIRRHVVQVDEKEALEKYAIEQENKPAEQLAKPETPAQTSIASTTVHEWPEPEIAIERMENGKKIHLEEPTLHTYKGRQHLIYAQDGDEPVPSGFKEVDMNDPEYSPVPPIVAILVPLEEICTKGLVPVFLCFVISAIYGWFIRRDEDLVVDKIAPVQDVNSQP